jgi:hypothetical protein
VKRSIVKAIIPLIVLATGLWSCKHREQNSEAKAIYTDNKPRSGETWTNARLRPLNAYAHDLLNDFEVERDGDQKVVRKTGRKEPLQKEAEAAFQNRGIDPALVLPLNKPGSEGKRGNYNFFIAEDSNHCFYEGNFDRDIYWSGHLTQVQTQLKHIARFIKDFHVAIEGQVDQPFVFNDIELCSRKSTGYTMRWRPGGKLEIGLPYNVVMGGSYRPLSPTALMDLWTRGEMFDPEDKVMAALKTGWPLFNPMSRFRKNIVSRFQKWSKALLGSLDKVQVAGSSAIDSERLVNLVRGNVDKSRLTFDPMEAIKKVVANNQQEEFIGHWRQFTADPDNHEGLIGANTAAASEKIKIRNKAHGWLVAVANYHRVAVEASVAVGDFKQFVKVDNPREVDIDIECKGAIAVCTIDDITVLLQFVKNNVHYEGSLETAGFHHAIRKTIGLP